MGSDTQDAATTMGQVPIETTLKSRDFSNQLHQTEHPRYPKGTQSWMPSPVQPAETLLGMCSRRQAVYCAATLIPFHQDVPYLSE